MADNWKSCILNGERLSCPHVTKSRHRICEARRNDVFMVQFFYFGIKIVNVLDL